MIEFIYIPIYLFLYLRTFKYKILIDDNTDRKDYLWMSKQPKWNPETYKKVRDKKKTLEGIFISLSVLGCLHYLFGWKVALMYAVFPLNVSGFAWQTGNRLYMTSTLLILATHIFVIALNQSETALFSTIPIEIALSSGLYLYALIVTIQPLFYLPIALYYGAWWLVIPVAIFLTSKRFKTGVMKRHEDHKNLGVSSFNVKNLRNVPCTLAYYIRVLIYPDKLGFFHNIGTNKEYFTAKFFSASVALLVIFTWVGFLVDPFAICLFILSLGLFSQYVILGQFWSERYTYVANIGMCIILSTLLPHEAFIILCTLYFSRSLSYVKAYKSNINLFSYSSSQFPENTSNWKNLGNIYFDDRNYVSAIKPYLMALKLGRYDWGIHNNIAGCYANLGDFSKAKQHIDEAMKGVPKDQFKDVLDKRDRINMELKNQIRKAKRWKDL